MNEEIICIMLGERSFLKAEWHLQMWWRTQQKLFVTLELSMVGSALPSSVYFPEHQLWIVYVIYIVIALIFSPN